VVAAAIELDVVVEQPMTRRRCGLREPARAERRQLLLELALRPRTTASTLIRSS
jgi:hypothetical protein